MLLNRNDIQAMYTALVAEAIGEGYLISKDQYSGGGTLCNISLYRGDEELNLRVKFARIDDGTRIIDRIDALAIAREENGEETVLTLFAKIAEDRFRIYEEGDTFMAEIRKLRTERLRARTTYRKWTLEGQDIPMDLWKRIKKLRGCGNVARARIMIRRHEDTGYIVYKDHEPVHLFK